MAIVGIPRPEYVLDLFAGRWRTPSVDPDEIDQVMRCYDVGRWRLVRVLLGGRSSRNYLLATDRGYKVLKKYRWSLLSTAQEHSVLRHLEDTDFPFPRLTLNREGASWTEVGPAHYAIYDFVPGFRCDRYYLPAEVERRFLVQAGEILARFHQLVRGFVPQGRKVDGFTPDGKQLWRDTGWHLDTLERHAARSPDVSYDSVAGLSASDLDILRRELLDLGRWHAQICHPCPKQVIHGDYIAKNVLFNSGGLAGVLDFGSARLDLRAMDIAIALGSFAWQGRYGVDPRKARIFVDAYRRCVDLSDGEVALIPKLSRWRLSRMIVWRLREETSPRRKLASVRDRWARMSWWKRNEGRLVDALLTQSSAWIWRLWAWVFGAGMGILGFVRLWEEL